MNGILRLPRRGFTLVELLIVIVVIGILAAITLVAYNGVQQSATNAAMKSDVSSIVKFIELYHAEHGQVPPISGNTLCLTQDNSCTNYAGTQITASNTSLLNMLSPYGSVPQSVAHLGSDYGIYATFSSNYSYETSSGAATSTPTPVLVVFWLQGTNQDCTGITGMTSVSGNNPFYPGNYSNPSTANNALTRCYEVFTGYTQ